MLSFRWRWSWASTCLLCQASRRHWASHTSCKHMIQ
jgi:hypothetical protein